MKKRLVAGVMALTGIGVVAAPTAHAEETTCRGTLGVVTVDNVRVPQGATCTLNRTRVQGTVKVERNATLHALAVRVIGNVQGENAANVRVLQGSSIGGSVQVVQGGASTVADSFVNGNILHDANRRAIATTRNRVGGDVQAFQNTGGVSIANNRIDGNLQCKANQPAPTGGGNIVQGNKEDQCARL
jgi:hypothetical protein